MSLGEGELISLERKYIASMKEGMYGIYNETNSKYEDQKLKHTYIHIWNDKKDCWLVHEDFHTTVVSEKENRKNREKNSLQ